MIVGSRCLQDMGSRDALMSGTGSLASAAFFSGHESSKGVSFF